MELVQALRWTLGYRIANYSVIYQQSQEFQSYADMSNFNDIVINNINY